jgi:hypothetical protein
MVQIEVPKYEKFVPGVQPLDGFIQDLKGIRHYFKFVA